MSEIALSEELEQYIYICDKLTEFEILYSV